MFKFLDGQPNQLINQQWRGDDRNINTYAFNTNNDNSGLNPDLIGTPLDFYHCIVNKETTLTIVIETNRYATQQSNTKTKSSRARINKWHDTNECEKKTTFWLSYMDMINISTVISLRCNGVHTTFFKHNLVMPCVVIGLDL